MVEINWPERHKTQLWLYLGLIRLRDDLLPDQASELQRSALDKAIAVIEPISGIFARQGDLDQRYLALTGALRSLAEVIAQRPREIVKERGLPSLEGFWDLMSDIDIGVGEAFRKKESQKLRGLYVIVDPHFTLGRDPIEIVNAALKGGATAIQYRDKQNDKGDSIGTLLSLLELCKEYNAALIVNDHPDLAVISSAHGIHVGQHDLSAKDARKVLKAWQILGVSNALFEEAIDSYKQGADYIAVGAMFSSNSKSNTRPAGPETLKRIREEIPIGGPPVVAIGGINKTNVAELAQAGADGICVIEAVALAEDPERASYELLQAFNRNN